jgi:predicted CXXCH cytochrome family protein
MASCFVSTIASAGIVGTEHDFKGRAWNTSGEVCVVCHTPHNALNSAVDKPLWDHYETSSVFTLYDSNTFEGFGTIGQPDGHSLMCLSCHDGTVAVDSFGGATGSELLSGADMIGTDLSDDHPISFTYDTTLATTDGGLYDPSTQTSGLGGTVDDDMLFGGKVQCSSCHNVHDDTIDPFLRKSNAASALCLTCHNK